MSADRKAKIVIIGGGPAGLAAAAAAVTNGTEAGDILILERDNVLGGILNQCIHNGFGLHTFKEELTGPEYAARFIRTVEEDKIPYLLGTIVVDISAQADGSKIVSAMNRTDGFFTVETDAVILAMGCRERPRGALNIPGYRPAGIYTAGTAQRFVNIEGRMPGHEVVILGSGDIGLIMARRMTLEGAKVKVVAELLPYSGGLKRNIVQCLDDFGIPLKLSHTVTNIQGRERVEAVTIAEVGPDRKPVPGTEETYTCDTLLLSCGLIPENELSGQLGIAMNGVTSGPVVNESLETSIPGVFACGNVLHVHDLVDYVSEEAANAGANAAAYIREIAAKGSAAAAAEAESLEQPVELLAKDGVRYTVPSSIHVSRMNRLQVIRFRVGAVYRNASVVIDFNDKVFRSQKKRILAPGEMEQVILTKEDLTKCSDLKTITIRIETEDKSV
jgi:NADPH-dependent 2,4-dienoyl-CoA reductase/sulfur reductase-like enzyme